MCVNCSCNDEIQLIMTAERSIAILHMFRLRLLIQKLCILWWWYVVMKISEQTKKYNWNWKDVDGISRNITRYTSSKWMELRGSRFVSDAIIYVCAHLNWMRGGGGKVICDIDFIWLRTWTYATLVCGGCVL